MGNNCLQNLADVGLNSLYANDCSYLAKMAKELGKPADAKELDERHRKYATVTSSLWDEKSGIFLNKYVDTLSFSKRLSPTLFYPMLAGIASPSQADRMFKEHFYNPKEFYGDVIMPSCSRNDKSFDIQYWRGSEWPPLNFLVYLGLRNYNKPAPKELAKKSYELFISAWTKDQCVYENINALKGVANRADQLNCDPFYHWGALMGIMQFMEEEKF
ncbi:MAG: trehalase family glycosidase [Ferruginibacter sp.]